jgi:hypothetical protein
MSWTPWFTPIIPATWEQKLGESQFEANLGKMLVRPHLNKTSYIYDPSYSGGLDRGNAVQGWLLRETVPEKN